MPKIFKRHIRPEADKYVLPEVMDLVVDPQAAAPEPELTEEPEALPELPEEPEEELSPEEQELSYARIQAEAILADARAEAERYAEEQRAMLAGELDQIREDARKEGYAGGYAEGMEAANAEGRRQQEELAREQIQAVERFLEQAARERDRLFDRARDEMKDLAVAVAEKVIRVSLKNSSDILLRMVDAATDTHKRCEWAHIYVADCDLHGRAYTSPELTAALGHISNRIRVVPMADDESGTCIVELPDVILDASVSTQLGNIREILAGATLDPEE